MKIFLRVIVIFLFPVFLWSCEKNEENPNNTVLPAKDLFNLSYGNASNQIFDIYLPEGRSIEETPLIIYIHGGGWIEGSKEEFLQFRPEFEKEFPEYAIASINYRLYDFITGANKFPTQENDVIAAIRFIQSQTDSWNISDNIILAGASAGGHLALLHGYKHQSIGNIQAVIAFFPPTDLTALYSHNQITALGLNALLGGSPQEKTNLYRESSPINFITSEVVPTIFFHGTADNVVPVSQSDLLADRLDQLTDRYEYIRIQNQGHGFTDAIYSDSFRDAANFLDRY